MKILYRAGLALLAAAACALADVSYSEAIHYTGGTLLDMMKNMSNGPMGKMMGGRMGQAFQDQTVKIYLKGNKMARVSANASMIFDLDAGTMTTIDNTRRIYVTTTFDELKQRMEQMKQRMAQDSQVGDIQFEPKLEQTGNTKNIAGQTASEYILTLTAKGNQGSATKVRSDMWVVPSVPGNDELRAFRRRMVDKMGVTSGFNPLLGQASSGLSQLTKETMKIEGFPVTQDTAVSGVQSPMAQMMGGDQNADPNAPFLSLTTEASNFATGPVNDSVFQIPAGYKEQKMPQRGSGMN